MNTTAERVIVTPPVNPENERYFEAAKQGTLLIGKCIDCGALHFYPRVLCPHCLSDKTEWVAAKGIGTIYSHSTMRRGALVLNRSPPRLRVDPPSRPEGDGNLAALIIPLA